MAGKNETPRQKMIGMMYLVLTALLALNVDSTVIDKFIFINESLEEANSKTNEYNDQTLEKISAAVKESGNRTEDVAVMEQAKAVRSKTNEVFASLASYKDTFLELTGGMEAGKKDYDKVGHHMMNKDQGKHGKELKELLNGYSTFLNSTLKSSEYKPIAYDGKDDPKYKDEPKQHTKDFATLTFESTPMPAGLATISQFQSTILSYEVKALEALAGKVGAKDLKFDRIIPMVRPESRIVAAGTNYKADMFISASSSGIKPTMYMNGKPIQVEGGFGKVDFKVGAAAKYDKDGMAEKSFEAAISLKLPGGRDTTYKETIKYFVVKPTISVQSASVGALYLNCGNELDVQVPQLGANYNPAFTASGAAVIRGRQKGLVTLVPNKAKVRLNVSSGGSAIGSRNFPVRRVPKPDLQVLTSKRKPVNERQGNDRNELRSLEAKAIADESFKQFLPKDARYRVTKWEVTLARGARPIGAPMRMTREKANLSQLLSKAQSGDRLVVEIKEVKRMNFRDNIEKVNMPPSYFSINIK